MDEDRKKLKSLALVLSLILALAILTSFLLYIQPQTVIHQNHVLIAKWQTRGLFGTLDYYFELDNNHVVQLSSLYTIDTVKTYNQFLPGDCMNFTYTNSQITSIKICD